MSGLASLPVMRADRTQALIVVILSTLVFLALVPFARIQLAPTQAFIPIYQSVLVINDVVTATLLLMRAPYRRSRGLLVLACGYLFTGLMAAVHMLTFPGLFVPGGLLGAGPQTTAWLYMFWHAGMPTAVLVYAMLDDGDAPERRHAIGPTIAATVALVGACTLLVTVGQGLLPPIMQGNR